MSERELAELEQQVRGCTACPLHLGRTKAVPGSGPFQAEIMLIGEGPGFHEDRQGLPFVGASGQFLDELLGMAGLQRPDVYITNVVKCRPPQNRDPEPGEIETCTSLYLRRQIALIDPKVIVTLGRHSMGLFFPGARIMKIHGQPKLVEGRLVVPMLHPAAALHQPQNRPIIEADFRKLPEILEQAVREQGEAEAEPKPDEPQQLSMF